MATTFASAAIAVPSFAGLKAEITPKTVLVKASGTNAAPAKVAGIRASTLKDVGIGAVAVATASMLLAGDAMAALVKLGDDNGGLVFEPKELVVAPGEKIVFKNNTGFPHNVLFDEDAVPAGVDASKISMGENDLLNAPGETYEVSLETKGDYEFYCAPHQGAGMVGKVTVS